MAYIEGFIAAVPTTNKNEFAKHAREMAGYFKKLVATRCVECWGDDVPKGVLTDFYKATQARDGETPIFSWIEYPDKATRDAANKKDGRRFFDADALRWQAHILGGFEQVVNE